MLVKDFLRASLVVFGFSVFAGAPPLEAAGSLSIPVPAVIIYPGDIIAESSLIDREVTQAGAVVRGAIESRSSIVGKVARRTLLPGAPIPWNALAEPKLVANGAKVRIVFQESGLTIVSYGSALQSGGLGDIVSVRNTDSGLTVSGKVQPDGSIRVNGS